MFCLSCSTSQRLAEVDADEQAIADLGRQIRKITDRKERGIQRSVRDQLKTDAALEARLRRGLLAAKKKIYIEVRRVVETGSIERLALMRNDQMSDWLINTGLDRLVFDFSDAQQTTLKNVGDLMRMISDDFSMNSILGITDALADETTSSLFDDVIIPDTIKTVRDSLTAAKYTTDKTGWIESLKASLASATGRQVTEARTKISNYGREVTVAAADEAGLDLMLYSGPKDGITRPFCRVLVGKAYTRDQISKLNNHSLNPPIVRAGGYNCRHSWAPLSRELAAETSTRLGTDSDIIKANSEARRSN